MLLATDTMPRARPTPTPTPELTPAEREHHTRFMRLALDEARRARHLGEVPVGAVLVEGNEVLAGGFNQPIRALDATAHAEIVCVRVANRRAGNYRLPGTTLYVTLEPCVMCVGALIHARVERVVFGAREPKSGALLSVLEAATLPLNHRLQVVPDVLAEECRSLVVDFFRYRRAE
jgi:tRNA(adenine34) deaminase